MIWISIGICSRLLFGHRKDVPGPLLFTDEEVVAAIKNIDNIIVEYKDKYDDFYENIAVWRQDMQQRW